MTLIKLEEIENYGKNNGVENFSPKIKNTILKNKLYIENINLSKNKPNVEYMLHILKENEPIMYDYYKKIYDKILAKGNSKYKSFNEYMESTYGQLGISKVVDNKSKKEDGEYYSREEYLNNKGELIECDIYRGEGDIYDFCKEKNIYDMEFMGWGFNIH